MVGFNLSLMTLFDAGRAFTQSQYSAWFAKAELGEAARIVLPSGGSLLWARKA
jgi:hypothetical protein